MDAGLYVYAYLLLSIVYAAACLQYLNSVTRTTSLAKRLQPPGAQGGSVSVGSEPERADTQTAVRAVLDVDSAAFGCAVLPVAYIAVTTLLGSAIMRNTAAAAALNPLWLTATVALIAAHMFFLVRIIGLNTQLRGAQSAVLPRSFVSRQNSMLTYYRVFILVVTVFNAANTLYLLANLTTVTKLPYVM